MLLPTLSMVLKKALCTLSFLLVISTLRIFIHLMNVERRWAMDGRRMVLDDVAMSLRNFSIWRYCVAEWPDERPVFLSLKFREMYFFFFFFFFFIIVCFRSISRLQRMCIDFWGNKLLESRATTSATMLRLKQFYKLIESLKIFWFC